MLDCCARLVGPGPEVDAVVQTLHLPKVDVLIVSTDGSDPAPWPSQVVSPSEAHGTRGENFFSGESHDFVESEAANNKRGHAVSTSSLFDLF